MDTGGLIWEIRQTDLPALNAKTGPRHVGSQTIPRHKQWNILQQLQFC